MREHYVIMIGDGDVKRVLRLLEKFQREGKARVVVVGIHVSVSDPRILGGIKRVADVHLIRGVMLPPVKVKR